MKWKRDSVIWLNARKLGLEIARAQITPDSVYVLDRINNQYAAKSITWLREEYDLPGNWDLLQNMLLGNPTFFTSQFVSGVADGEYVLQAEGGDPLASYYLSPDDYRLVRTVLDRKADRQQLIIEQEDWRPIPDGNREFPYIRILRAEEPTLGNLEIKFEFSRVELDQPQAIRFEIPDRYTRME